MSSTDLLVHPDATSLDDIDEALHHARRAIRTATTVPHRQACERYLDELLDQRAGTTR
jgi:hypothetical protein